MRKKIFFGIGIVLLCLIAWGIHLITRVHGNVANETAVASLSAISLYEQFAKSEVQAGKNWTGKVIEITGAISSLQLTGNYMSVTLKGTAEGGINCNILKKDLDPERKLTPGNTITIKGKCSGFLIDVNMVDCVVVK
jgi:hypothetical protein